MNTPLTIAVIGGTGKSGRYVVRQLLNDGYRLKMLLRHPENFTLQSPLIDVIQGDARDSKAIHTLLKGCDAVVSTLGQPKGESSIFSTATTHVLHAMHDHGIRRYIVTTGLNVDAPGDVKGPRSQAATEWMRKTYPETTFDKQKEFELLLASDIDWTMVRLPLIELTDERKPTEVSLVDCAGEKIHAADLAAFIAAQLKETTYHRKAPFLFNVV